MTNLPILEWEVTASMVPRVCQVYVLPLACLVMHLQILDRESSCDRQWQNVMQLVSDKDHWLPKIGAQCDMMLMYVQEYKLGGTAMCGLENECLCTVLPHILVMLQILAKHCNKFVDWKPTVQSLQHYAIILLFSEGQDFLVGKTKCTFQYCTSSTY